MVKDGQRKKVSGIYSFTGGGTALTKRRMQTLNASRQVPNEKHNLRTKRRKTSRLLFFIAN